MKKVFAILAISVAMVSCNNDSAADAAKMAEDSTRMADSSAKVAAEAAAKMAADTIGMKIDTATKAVMDTMKK